jgi:hypothetical protein
VRASGTGWLHYGEYFIAVAKPVGRQARRGGYRAAWRDNKNGI